MELFEPPTDVDIAFSRWDIATKQKTKILIVFNYILYVSGVTFLTQMHI